MLWLKFVLQLYLSDMRYMPQTASRCPSKAVKGEEQGIRLCGLEGRMIGSGAAR